MVEIEVVISTITKIIIFIGLYFTTFWILVLFNSNKIVSKKITKWPSVSIIIPAYNEENGIERTIKSCINLNYKGKLNIYVVNDASSDGTVKVVNKYLKYVTLIDKKKNGGKAAAINTALEKVNCDLIGVVDADSEISKDSLANMVKYFLVKSDGDKVGAVISKMKPDNENGNILERIQLIEYLMVGLIRSLSASMRLLHLTPGVLSVYRADLIKKLGGFDSKNMTEDFEVGVKVRKAGFLIHYAHDSEVYTTTPNNFKMFMQQRIRWSRGFIQTHSKHKDIFFNRKYGLFGIYQFPMNVLGPILYFLAVFTISFNVYRKMYEFLFKLIYTPDLIEWFVSDSINDMLLTFNPTVDLIIILSLFLMLFLFYGVIKFYDYNFFKKNFLNKVWAFIIYIMVYNYIYIYVWIVSIMKELKGEKYDWGTK